MDLACYVSKIKNNAYGTRASQTHYKFRHNVNMQFNKIPTTSYVNATRDGGIDFARNREENYSNP